MASKQELLDRVLAMKASQRAKKRAESWPEKIAVIERLRDTTIMARQAMRAHKRPK